MAATRMPKLKLMLNDDSVFLRTQIEVSTVREYLARTDNQAPERPLHPTQILSQKNAEEQLALTNGEIGSGEPGADGQEDAKEDPRPASQRSGADGAGNTSRNENLKKVLSHKAIQIGSESGVTAEFIVKQTGEQLVSKLDDLFLMFDTFQEALYSNDPAINRGANGSVNSSQKGSQKSASQSVVDHALGRMSSNNSENQVAKSDAANNKVMYEESILMTLLGPDYMQFISEETGEWINEEQVVEKFQELFETRIRCIFDA